MSEFAGAVAEVGPPVWLIPDHTLNTGAIMGASGVWREPACARAPAYCLSESPAHSVRSALIGDIEAARSAGIAAAIRAHAASAAAAKHSAHGS